MKKKCRICGESFESCTTEFDSILGNWKQFCCSYECAKIYYEQIMESRNPKETAKVLQDFNNKSYNETQTEQIETEEVIISSTNRRKFNNI